MAWYNPSTWSFVDKLQGQSNKQESTDDYMKRVQSQDPNKVRMTLNGVDYNFAGDPIPKQNNQAASSKYAQELADMRRQIQSLSVPQPYIPKLISFDIMGNYQRAQKQAEKAVNPLYNKYLNDFLAGQKQQKKIEQDRYNLAKESNRLELENTLGENQLSRGRTAEDFMTAITQLGEQEGQMQEDTGRQFDSDRRMLAEQNAAAGMTTSGIGAAAMFEQQDLRNISEERQVKEFNNQREAKQLFKDRTFEDLARGDELAQKVAGQRDKKAKFDLDAFLAEIAQEERVFRAENEFKRLTDIINQTSSYERAGRQQFLQQLAGGGYDPRDVEYTQGIYNLG